PESPSASALMLTCTHGIDLFGRDHFGPTTLVLSYLIRLARLYKGPSWSYIDFEPTQRPPMAADTTSLHLRLPKNLHRRLRRQAPPNNGSLKTENGNHPSNPQTAIFPNP